MKTPEITLEQFNEAMLYARLGPNRPKKIKITSDFYNYLVAKTEDEVVLHKDDNSHNGYYDTFVCLPIEIDNTIEDKYYELVY